MKANLQGELVQRSDESYDAARKVYNSMIDKHPAAPEHSTDALKRAHEDALERLIGMG